MLKCPKCNAKTKVLHTLPSQDPHIAIRERKCTRCRTLYHTEERILEEAVKETTAKLRFVLSGPCPEEYRSIAQEESDRDGEEIDASEILRQSAMYNLLAPSYRHETRQVLSWLHWKKDTSKKESEVFAMSLKNIKRFYELYLEMSETPQPSHSQNVDR